MVERFRSQIRDAWSDAEFPAIRIHAVRHMDCECDELWAWLLEMNTIAMDDRQVEWSVPWCLLAPKAVAYALGPCILAETQGKVANEWRESLWNYDRFADILSRLNNRQRWCVLKMLIWGYLERPAADVFELIQMVRAEMGFHPDWPRPRSRAQT
jgi:hypothetical protein